jgi:RNA polymerase-binding transcription factor DksA
MRKTAVVAVLTRRRRRVHGNGCRPVAGSSDPGIQVLRARLSDELRKLLARLEELRGDLRESVPDVTDPEELAEVDGRRDTAAVEITRISSQVEHARAALDDLDAGRYGICVCCRERISEERLTALPLAKLCIGCARAEED